MWTVLTDPFPFSVAIAQTPIRVYPSTSLPSVQLACTGSHCIECTYGGSMTMWSFGSGTEDKTTHYSVSCDILQKHGSLPLYGCEQESAVWSMSEKAWHKRVSSLKKSYKITKSDFYYQEVFFLIFLLFVSKNAAFGSNIKPNYQNILQWLFLQVSTLRAFHNLLFLRRARLSSVCSLPRSTCWSWFCTEGTS